MNGLAEPVSQYDGGQLQTRGHRDLLDVIDTLRSQGIGRYVDLPQIIVCGDQSSGKSSVLEAISGLSFPTKDNLCTRFATELILRRNPAVGINIHIIPGHDRSEDERKKLESFQHHQEALDISQVVEAAKRAMGLDGGNQVFSTDILRVEISGPTQPHLTMVDLPGLFLAGNKDQSEDDARLVKTLVLSYMKKPRSIILAVVSAKSDFALQQVTRHARALDPEGVRTLGLITKPDTLDTGSDSERFYVELAQNKDVKFRLGWHVLRNRSYVTREASAHERDQVEAEFFSTGAWTALDGSQLGVANLRVRLSNVLHDQIVTQLPSVLQNVETGINECENKLSKLGAARGTMAEQRRHLLTISAAFSRLMKASVDGTYTDPFFFDTDASSRYSKRLRAVVQNTLVDFAEDMSTKGHAKIITEGVLPPKAGPRYISRLEYIKEVKSIMREGRGRELPGSYNPLIVGELFGKQCKPWGGLVDNLGNCLLQSAHITISAVLDHVADEETATGIIHRIVMPSMETVKEALTDKLEEILHPHLKGHPITYNHYLTENVQKAQAERKRRDMESRLEDFFEDDLADGVATYEFSMKSLLDALMSNTEPDMDSYACSMAIDMMQAYYKVALKTVVDEVSVLAIEKCLIQQPPQLLSPEMICDLTDEEVRLIAAESEMSVAERKRLSEKLVVLQRGFTQLGKFRKQLIPVKPMNSGGQRIQRPGG
ncbi:P-loop containing nucleoside triphosphate hydrolase protein [Xylaria palmicola]|nr:P-loop containing nucleoside triphosphate hydrolase protein [Xylaria palmicola]